MQFILKFITRYLNNITFSRGIKLPLYLVDVKTLLSFEGDSIYLMLDFDLEKGFTVDQFINNIINPQFEQDT